jgi:putative ABC transport system permease protein
MTGITLKSIWAHKRRLIGMCAAVILGITFFTGTLVLSDSMRAGFGNLFAEANAGTDVVVRGANAIGVEESQQRNLIAVDELAGLRAVEGVAAAEPSIVGLGQIEAADGSLLGGDGPPTAAGNWIVDAELNPYQIVEGRPPRANGEVVIDRRSADRGGLPVGSNTVVRTPEPVDVQVVGVVTFGSSDNMSGSTFVGFTYDDAQRHLLDGAPALTSVVVRAERGVDQDELAARLAVVAPPDTEVITGEALTDEQLADLGADFLDFFRAFLLVFTGIALVVAAFSIYNTFSVIVAQRTRESALLRAIGASRAQIIRATTFEALIVGLLASVAGAAAGVGVGAGMLGLLGSFDLAPATGLTVSTTALITALVLGTSVTIVASLAPAIRSSRVPPLAALRDVAIDRSATSRPRAALGTVLAVAGAGVLAVATRGDGDGVLVQAALGAIVLMIGMVVLGPVAARATARTVGIPVTIGQGVVGRLARHNASRDPKRMASTSSALMVGVAVVTLFTVFGASIKASIDQSVSQSFGGDLVISTSSFSSGGVSTDLARELDELPAVGTATGIGTGAVRLAGTDAELVLAEPAALDEAIDVDVVAGSLGDLEPGELAVHVDTAQDRGWGLDAVVPVEYADGARETLQVGALYGSGELLGEYVIDRDTFEPHATTVSDDAVFVTLADGVDVRSGRQAIEPVADRYGATQVQDKDEFVAGIAAEIDQFLSIVYVLLAVSVFIALMGIANTLSLSIHERTRELGLLRAVGQTRRQTRAMVRGEAMIISIFGTVGGIALGLFLGWGLVRATAATEGLGVFSAPLVPLAVVVGVGAIAGVVAAMRPARRASRLDVLDAIATA